MAINKVAGHRARMRERFLTQNIAHLDDYEIIEMLLSLAQPRKDVKPIAKDLMNTFRSFDAALGAHASQLQAVKGMGKTSITMFKVIHEAMCRILRNELKQRPLLNSGQKVLEYCKLSMAYLSLEQTRILYLNRKNYLICDEIQTGTVDQTPIYPREIMKRCLELGASAIIVVHNHPSGDPSPSREDIYITKQIQKIGTLMGIDLHDHIIVSKYQSISLKAEGLL